ncbi:hypothetical protein TrLO_g4568 [Triparma laevis f. longispina]|uniref:Uncharacterized protein n=1 Tax=Triparma laevis f. longispina TaxID=1714387 RepID=A0A9W7FVG7_9STRA|nr:hypothetical protein TrLO_g4568 [Triparma laevis f. longispina]
MILSESEIDLDLIVIDSPPPRPPSGLPPPLPPSSPLRLEYTRLLTSGYLYRTDSLLTSLSRSFTSLVIIDFMLWGIWFMIFCSGPEEHIIFLFHLLHLPRCILGHLISHFIFPDILQRLDSKTLTLYQSLGVTGFADFFKVVIVEFHEESKKRDGVVNGNKMFSRKNKVLGWTILTLLCGFLDFCALMTSMFGIKTGGDSVCFFMSMVFFSVDLGLLGTLAQPAFYFNGGRGLGVKGVWGALFGGEGLFPDTSGGGGREVVSGEDDQDYDLSRNMAAMQGDLGMMDTRAGTKLQRNSTSEGEV